MNTTLRFATDPGMPSGYVANGVRAEYGVWKSNDSLRYRRWCVTVTPHGARFAEHHDFRYFADAKKFVREHDAIERTSL